MKHRIQNLESSIQKRGKDRRGAATDATRIKDGFGQWRIGRKRTQRAQRIEGMMGADAGGNLALVGKGGRNGRFLADIFPPLPAFSQHFPPFPTFSHFIFILWPSGAGWEMGCWIIGAVGGRSGKTRRAGGGFMREKVRIVARRFTMFHEGPRKFAQIRPVNPRLFGLLRVGVFFSRLAIFEQD